MAEAYFLSAEDVKLVKELLAEKRSKRGNTQGRPGAQDVDHQEHQAPEVYTAYTTNGITARSGTTPGEGQVYIYQTNLSEPGTATLEDTYLDVTVRNLSTTAVAAGEYLLVHRTKDGQWYVGGSGGAAGASSCDGCDWFAGASSLDCFTLTVVSATGAFEDLDTNQELTFEWDADNDYWESTTDFTVCGNTGPVRLSRSAGGDPLLYLVDPGYYLTLGCCDPDAQTMTFSGGNSGEVRLCPFPVVMFDGDCPPVSTEDGPANNLFTVRIAYTRCPNEDWAGEGWYCVAATGCAGSRQCCYLTEDPGDRVILCSGPHADEATCEAACAPPTTVSICSETLPAVLYLTWPLGIFEGGGSSTYLYCPDLAPLAGTSTQLNWNVGTSRWEASITLGCGTFLVELVLTCPSTWGLLITGDVDSAGPGTPTNAMRITVISSSPLELRTSDGGNQVTPDVCCENLLLYLAGDYFTITE